MGEVDLTLAKSDRAIDRGKVARLQRSKDKAKAKKGRLLQAVVDWRDEHAPPEPEPPEAA